MFLAPWQGLGIAVGERLRAGKNAAFFLILISGRNRKFREKTAAKGPKKGLWKGPKLGRKRAQTGPKWAPWGVPGAQGRGPEKRPKIAKFREFSPTVIPGGRKLGFSGLPGDPRKMAKNGHFLAFFTKSYALDKRNGITRGIWPEKGPGPRGARKYPKKCKISRILHPRSRGGDSWLINCHR